MEDISLHIFKFLPIKDIHSFGLVNKEFYKGYLNELLWENILDRDYYSYYYNINQNSKYKTYEYCHKLNTLRDELKYMPIDEIYALEKFDMWFGELGVKSKNISLLTNLQMLSIEFDNRSYFPVEIGLLTNLEELCLCDNKFMPLPLELFQLTKLKNLEIKENKLKLLSPKIGLLTNLKYLNMNDNCLKSLPTEISQLTNFERVIFILQPIKIISKNQNPDEFRNINFM